MSKSWDSINLTNPLLFSIQKFVSPIYSFPEVFALHQNYPNPFNPSTQISFDVPEGSELVRLNIYNILGKKVSTLLNNVVNPGRHKVEWNAKDNEGNPVASGIYFYELSSSTFSARKKMLLIR